MALLGRPKARYRFTGRPSRRSRSPRQRRWRRPSRRVRFAFDALSGVQERAHRRLVQEQSTEASSHEIGCERESDLAAAAGDECGNLASFSRHLSGGMRMCTHRLERHSPTAGVAQLTHHAFETLARAISVCRALLPRSYLKRNRVSCSGQR